MSAIPAAAVTPATLSDEEIVVGILAGETALFEILMRRHNEQVYRAARAILRDEREAEDVMQEAYVNAYTHLAQFDRRAKFSTWLTKIAVYEALGRARRRGRYESIDSSVETFMPVTTSPDPEREAFGRELGALIESALDRLGDGYREVFMLRQVQGLSTAETAEVLGVSDDVVKTRFSRARHALQNDLLERVGGASAEAFTFGQARCDAVVAKVMAVLTSKISSRFRSRQHLPGRRYLHGRELIVLVARPCDRKEQCAVLEWPRRHEAHRGSTRAILLLAGVHGLLRCERQTRVCWVVGIAAGQSERHASLCASVL